MPVHHRAHPADRRHYLTTTVIAMSVHRRSRPGARDSFRVTDRFTVLANYGYTDSRYDEGIDPSLEERQATATSTARRPNVPEHTPHPGRERHRAHHPRCRRVPERDYAYSTRRYTAANNLSWLGNDSIRTCAGVQGSHVHVMSAT
jgi:hypothetical protein